MGWRPVVGEWLQQDEEPELGKDNESEVVWDNRWNGVG